jgi:ubiquinone/menaquinone biosynthesis C-methylase UbiE
MKGHPIFAALYDRITAGTERAGLGEMRRGLLAEASGRVLELGAGTGHNLEHYTDAVTELVMTEPDRHMARRLRDRLASQGSPVARASVVEARVEDLPFDDGSFDTVVATLVLWTIPRGPWRRHGGYWWRAESCSTSSMSAVGVLVSPAGRIGSSVPGV